MPRRAFCSRLDGPRESLLFSLAPLFSLARTVTLVAQVCAHGVVPPPEAGGVAANKCLMVVIMVVSACPERNPVVHADGEVIPRVCIDRLEETKCDPYIDGDDV